MITLTWEERDDLLVAVYSVVLVGERFNVRRREEHRITDRTWERRLQVHVTLRDRRSEVPLSVSEEDVTGRRQVRRPAVFLFEFKLDHMRPRDDK